MTTIHHNVEVTRSLPNNHKKVTWGAHCNTCGWVSGTHSNARDAMNDGDGHSIASADQVTTSHQS